MVEKYINKRGIYLKYMIVYIYKNYIYNIKFLDRG